MGYWGKNYLRLIEEIKDGILVQTCDSNPEIGSFHFVDHTKNYQDLIKNNRIDAVIISTDASTHYKITRDFLTAGIHVLVEKPLSLRSKECEELVKIASTKNLILMVGHIYYFNQIILEIKKILDDGFLGQPIRFSSRRFNFGPIRRDVDSMWDLGIHDLTILNYLFGCNPTRINVNKKNDDPSISQHYNYAKMDLSYGLINGQIETDWLYPTKIRYLEIKCTNGLLVFDEISSQKITTFKRDQDSYTEVKLVRKFKESEPLKSEVEYFIRSIKSESIDEYYSQSYIDMIKTLEFGDRSFKMKREMEMK